MPKVGRHKRPVGTGADFGVFGGTKPVNGGNAIVISGNCADRFLAVQGESAKIIR